VVGSSSSERDAVDEDVVDHRPNNCIPVSIDDCGYRCIEMHIRVVRSRISSPVTDAFTDRVDICVLGGANSLSDIVARRSTQSRWMKRVV
jgi:hypothetical protein